MLITEYLLLAITYGNYEEIKQLWKMLRKELANT